MLLIENIKSGKADFSIIYKKYYNYYKTYLFKKGASIDETNDVYQDTMIFLYNKMMSPDFKLTSKLSTFIYSIISNLWLKEIEKK